jgi:hypothetical protein
MGPPRRLPRRRRDRLQLVPRLRQPSVQRRNVHDEHGLLRATRIFGVHMRPHRAKVNVRMATNLRARGPVAASRLLLLALAALAPACGINVLQEPRLCGG